MGGLQKLAQPQKPAPKRPDKMGGLRKQAPVASTPSISPIPAPAPVPIQEPEVIEEVQAAPIEPAPISEPKSVFASKKVGPQGAQMQARKSKSR